MNKDQIAINNEIFSFIITSCQHMKTGKEKLYLWWGVQWRQLDREPLCKDIEKMKVGTGVWYYAKPIRKQDISSNHVGFHLFWDNKWYEMSTKPYTSEANS